MPQISAPHIESESMSSGSVVAWLVFGWLWVGVPLIWGISMTLISAFPLFQGLFGGHG